jgi:D-threo-aldose 1-dehydrogenase
MSAIPQRALGRGGLSLAVLGFGAAAIGNLYAAVDETEAKDAVRAALDAGLTYFDTAPHYGFGLSETRLGAVLPAQAQVSTKVGRVLVPAPDAGGERHGFVDAAPFEPVFDYSHDGVMRSLEASLKRLGRDRVEVLLAHDLGAVTHGDDHPRRLREFLDGGYLAMRALRDSGAVGAIGLGVNEWQVCEEILGHADLDVVLLAGRYTLLEQTALDSFLPLCAARGISVIVGGPFNSGVLVEGASRRAHYDYAPAPTAVVERVRALEAICADHRAPLAAAALQFPLAHGQVVSVIPGIASRAQALQAVSWLRTPLPDGLWSDLRQAGLLHPDAPTSCIRVPA